MFYSAKVTFAEEGAGGASGGLGRRCELSDLKPGRERPEAAGSRGPPYLGPECRPAPLSTRHERRWSGPLALTAGYRGEGGRFPQLGAVGWGGRRTLRRWPAPSGVWEGVWTV